MQVDAYLESLRAEGSALAASATRAGLDADVESCPGWQVRDVVGHTGVIHRWAADQIRAAGPRQDERGVPPTDDLLGWYGEGLEQLLDTLSNAPADLQCWTFFAAPSPLDFWARRQAHETAMHGADCVLAEGQAPDFAASFAADGIDELLTGFIARRRGLVVSDPPRTMLIAPTDSPLWWHVSLLPDRCETRTDGSQEADCVVRGTASDLYLLLWNRRPVVAADTTGDASLLDLWRERARI